MLDEHRRIWHTRDRAARDADVLAGDLLGHGLCQQGRVHPRLVKVEGALGEALVAVPRGVHAGVASVEQLEHVVLRLVVGARVADAMHRELRVLQPVALGAALAQRAPCAARSL